MQFFINCLGPGSRVAVGGRLPVGLVFRDHRHGAGTVRTQVLVVMEVLLFCDVEKEQNTFCGGGWLTATLRACVLQPCDNMFQCCSPGQKAQ